MRSLALVFMTLAFAPPALAGGPSTLSGVWEGSYSCKTEGAGGGGTFKPDGVSTLVIDQIGPTGPLNVRVEANGETGTFSGTLIPSATNPDEGAGAWIACGTSDGTANSSFNEIETFTFKLGADGKGTLKQVGVFVTNESQVGICKGTWKRVSTQPVMIPGCQT